RREDGGEGEPREGGRRRRRRGRRGGRRNRQRSNETQFQSGETGSEPGLQQAVDDLDRPPRHERAPDDYSAATRGGAYSGPIQEHPVSPAEYSPATSSAQEPSRRRSTVREPVSFSSDGTPAPSPASPSAPIVSSTGSEESAAPKRGWWGKRLLGDKD